MRLFIGILYYQEACKLTEDILRNEDAVDKLKNAYSEIQFGWANILKERATELKLQSQFQSQAEGEATALVAVALEALASAEAKAKAETETFQIQSRNLNHYPSTLHQKNQKKIHFIFFCHISYGISYL